MWWKTDCSTYCCYKFIYSKHDSHGAFKQVFLCNWAYFPMQILDVSETSSKKTLVRHTANIPQLKSRHGPSSYLHIHHWKRPKEKTQLTSDVPHLQSKIGSHRHVLSIGRFIMHNNKKQMSDHWLVLSLRFSLCNFLTKLHPFQKHDSIFKWLCTEWTKRSINPVCGLS